ncbi:cobyrinate a,c-diamide synthase [Lactobacillus sp. 3B(2020)]|uniref:cobyrinate a,c-diamide synthase n=1 Tax=Lactobacillus sp. 3B(2020) TaxID=2695882 RepID=UPI0015DE1E17|nr:cobyrinate a,c-diamide synthase [Lactobacillus sp. 3B(2020)]QLL69167.1 cobyrinate a,c-diamide synthase [Lactobacillus sp. 3B(2020)]
MKSFVIAGVTSGSGKTTATLGILAALQKKYQIQSYKIGPDYVDTKFHTRITGRPTRNLDNFLVPDPTVLKYLFTRSTNDVDLGIVEGVMGLYDGLGTDKDAASTSSIAKQLGLPVVLVVNAKATSTSAAAIVNGFVNFDPDVKFAGVIVNNVMGESHYQLVKGAIERYTPLKVFGYIPKQSEMSLPSRQLGLVPDAEITSIDEKIQMIAQAVEEHIDLDQLIAAGAEVMETELALFTSQQYHLRLGIAQDKAFNFYYADNIDLLNRLGVELIPFSPIKDQQLPDVDALYLGGGYPEEFAKELAANQAMRSAILAFSQANKPIYAECGGLMYLGKELVFNDQVYQMVGVFDGRSVMTKRLKKFGYCLAQPQTTTLLGKAGVILRGHEFHHSVFEPLDEQLQPVMMMQKVRDHQVVDTWTGGYQVRQTFASYLHVHFYQSPDLLPFLLTQLGADRQ